MHIAPFDNQNCAIVDIEDDTVPLNYFNIVTLTKGQAFEYQVPGYETCIAPATGTVDVEIEGFKVASLGGRVEDVWGGEPEGVYVPSGAKAVMVCLSDTAEVFVAGAKFDQVLDPFAVRADEVVAQAELLPHDSAAPRVDGGRPKSGTRRKEASEQGD